MKILCNVEDKVGPFECVQVTYTGNSKTCVKDEVWKNWNCIMVKQKPKSKKTAKQKKTPTKKKNNKRKQATAAPSAATSPGATINGHMSCKYVLCICVEKYVLFICLVYMCSEYVLRICLCTYVLCICVPNMSCVYIL